MNKMQGKITIVPTTQIKGSIKSSMIYPALEDLKVKSSSETQHFKSKAYGFNNVTVEPVVELQGDTLTVSPSTSTQRIVPESPANGFTEVNVNAVTSDIDSNIIPENIKQGTSILGVEGECKGEVETNVFMQETEPEKKDGIWLQGNYEVENIIADRNVFGGAEYNASKTSDLSSIPYNHIYGSASSVGTDIYLIGTSTSNYQNKIYKYDTINNTFTQKSATVHSAGCNASAVVGTNIYVFGSNNSSYYKSAKKYDSINDTISSLTSIPTNFYSGNAEAVGKDIFLFGGDASTAYRLIAYKYSTVSDTYSRLTNIPFSFYYGASAVIGTNIYLFGGDGGNTTAYKYDTLTDTYTKLRDIPYAFHNGKAKAVGTDIYLFGGETYKNYVYKYDTLTDTYDKLLNLGYSFYNGSLGFNDTDIYLFGGTDYPKKVQAVTLLNKEYPNNSIIITQGGDMSQTTNIADIGITNLKTYYDRVYYRDNNGQLLNSIPTYNGDGTGWTRI